MDYDIIPRSPSTTQIDGGSAGGAAGVGGGGGGGGGGVVVGGGGGRAPKIPRPANAFMLYANANRKKMARAYPLDSNKEISKRLGRSWKELKWDEKKAFYDMAKKVDAAHKAKYPDYVYNPKEARIRKAMRDANRERTMGVAPATRAARRTQPWVLQDQDEQFMMTTGHGMRGVASPMCGNGFPIVGSGAAGAQFMPPMHAYNKHIHLSPHDQSYLQTNPMAQLQHQTEMWHYHESTSPMRPTADQFMLPTSQMSSYHHQPQPTQDIDAVREKMKTPMETYAALQEDSQSHSPHSNANVSPASEQSFDEGKDTRSSTLSTGSPSQQTSFGSIELYQEDVIIQNPFEKDDSVSMRKNSTLTSSQLTTKPQKSLPDFNEAFGTTERGRFQSPPDPRLQPKQGYLDFFLTNNELKFDDFNI